MKIRKEVLLKLIQEKFRDNQAYFADTIGITREYVNRLLNNDSDVIESAKLCNKLVTYFISNGWEYEPLFILQ